MKLRLFSVLAVSSAALAPVAMLPSSAFAQPGAPTPVPETPTASTAPGPDTGADAKPSPKPLFWRGTTFTYDTAVTTSAVGIGDDVNGGEGQYAGMEWDANPNFYVLDLPKDKINIDADIGAGVELTNSDTTVTYREPYFKDIRLSGTYTRDIFTSKDTEWSTKGKLKANFYFPTSKVSMLQGKYLTMGASASIGQTFKLLGSASDALPNITVTVGVAYQHLFSRAYNPTNPGLERIRQNAHGVSGTDDQTTFHSFDIDRITPSLAVDLPLYKDLSLDVFGRLVGRFHHKYTSTTCVDTSTGCVTPDVDPNAVSYTTDSVFDVSLTQSIVGLVDITAGYDNESLTLAEDGRSRNPFYSPDAQFYLDITANIDEIYSAASGRSKVELPKTVAANKLTGMPAF